MYSIFKFTCICTLYCVNSKYYVAGTCISVSRPAWLGDTQLKLEVDVGNSTKTIVRVYIRPMFQIQGPSMFGFPVPMMVDTDNVTMLLMRIN